jgi:predicted nuclease of predicted toxin-antitoxin system
MGVLLPLYLAGLSALSLPLIFHLVRRTPRGRQNFSSLMFLAPTIPKLTRRSRIDQILLLLLRLAALALVAFAFARPFLREASLLSLADLSGRRVAILIDTSASMRRGDLWQQAVAQAEKEIDELNPQDDIALFTFSNRLQTIIDFTKDESAAIQDKPQVVRNRLQNLQPDWNTTDLGTALVAVASELDSTGDAQQSALEPQIIVISDFQAGSRTEAVRSFEWPKRVPVVARPIKLVKTTNAFVHVLPNEEGDELTETRVRVVNAADSKIDQFYLNWVSDLSPTKQPSETKKAHETAVYVPAGQSRVVRLPRGIDDLAANRIVLRGDDQDFDNAFYVVPPLKQAATVLYAGLDKPDSPEGLQYFLRLAVANDPLRQVEVHSINDPQPLFAPGDASASLVVVSQAVSAEWQTLLKSYVERGGTLLLVPENPAATQLLPVFFDDLELHEQTDQDAKPATPANKYLLLGDIDFAHPIFAPVAGARYSDFTKIHFWKHLPVSLKTPAKTHVIARFDNHDPALVERLSGQGRILALLSGWQPRDSQFAVSSKFVPFVSAILDLACGGPGTTASVAVNEPVNLPRDKASVAITVQKPDGRESSVAAGQLTFTDTDRPGIYLAKTTPKETRFAVNLAASESNTAPLDLEQLEQSGVKMGIELSRAERVERIRQQRDTELEGRQKIWRWLMVLAIGTLILETWLAGRQERALKTG